MGGTHRIIAASILSIVIAASPARALAWGNEGHEIIALIAQSFLSAATRQKVDALLAADPDTATAHDIASESTWADEIKSDRGLRQRTSKWHYIDIEVSNPNVDRACFDHPPLPGGTAAFNGPADDCILDKIDEFTAELASPATDAEERIVALKFLLHLVGDLHQPLHAADDNDRGGNAKRVSAPGMRPGNLHHYWDTEFVLALGPEPREVAAELLKGISGTQAKAWAKGTPSDWAQESFTSAPAWRTYSAPVSAASARPAER